MKLIVSMLLLTQILISNLSLAQTDSLKGQDVTIHFHKTKRTVTGKFRSYKDNRVTVLFDMSLHDYFYTEVKSLEFERFSFSFDEKGGILSEKTEYIFITKHGIYYGYIISENESEILIESNKIGKLFIEKDNIITKRKS